MSSSGRASRPRIASLTVRQRFLLAAILLAVPLVALGIAEVTLRLAGYGSDYPLFLPFEPVPEYLVPNADVARRYFRHEAALPGPMGDLFRADKPPGAYRIFVQGGSTAAGFPYYHGGAFSRMLEQRLQETFPDRAIEVVNVAMDATNSYTVLDLVPEIIAQRPDAVILYTGHNEFYGVLGVASAESVGRSRWIVRTYIGLQQLRTVQLLQATIDRAAAALWSIIDRASPPRRTLMEYLGSEHVVRYGSDLYEAGPRQLRANLDEILALYAAADVPVFIGTLASNVRDQPPFIGRPVPSVDSAAWERGLAEAAAAIDDGDTTAATARIRRLMAMDSTAPDPFFLLGRLRERQGDLEAARTAYHAARDRDQLPFRAPSPVNAVIRQSAERHGATVVETQAAFARASPGGMVGSTLMLEHLHPNIQGQFLLADAFYSALRDAGEIGAWRTPVPAEEARARVPVTIVDSLAAAYTITKLTARFPFVPAGRDSEPSETATDGALSTADPIANIARAYHEGRVPWIQALGRLQEHYTRAGHWVKAAHVNRVVAQEAAHAPDPLLIAAQAEMRAGRDARALEDVAAAERRQPTARGAHLAGDLAARRGDTAAARALYQRAARLDPRERGPRAALRALSAIPDLERTTAREPGNLDALVNLGITYLLTGRWERARELALHVLREAPDHPGATGIVRQLGPIYRSENE